MTRFGTLVRRVDERGRGLDLPLMSVSQTLGVVRRSELTKDPPRADSLDEYKICRAGDIIFNKMSIRDGAMGVAREDGLVTYHYEVMRPLPGADPRYVVYLMKSQWFIGELIKRERGIGAGGTSGVRTTEVPFSVLRTIDAPIADSVAQRAIADYLDTETERIDELVARRRRQLELLDQHLDSYLDARVRELVAASGPRPLKRFAHSIEQGWSPECDAVPANPDEWGVLKTSAVTSGVFDGSQNKRLPAEIVPDPRWVIRDGDLLVVRGSGSPGAVGQAAVARTEGRLLLLADLLYRVRLTTMKAEFAAFVLRSRYVRDQFEAVIRTDVGMTRKIRTEDLGNVLVPAASEATQNDVVKELNGVESGVAATRAACEAQVQLLLERRETLITAAVTAEVQIPGAAA